MVATCSLRLVAVAKAVMRSEGARAKALTVIRRAANSSASVARQMVNRRPSSRVGISVVGKRLRAHHEPR